MKLVKDYINERTVYYWITAPDNQEAISPQFRSFTQAEEWWKEQKFSQIDSPTRRRDSRTSERRYSEEDLFFTPESKPIGDMAIQVDIDWHKEKAD